jgi:hypothetical protein
MKLATQQQLVEKFSSVRQKVSLKNNILCVHVCVFIIETFFMFLTKIQLNFFHASKIKKKT